MVARYKVWVCDHSLVGIAVSNPAGGMVVCLFWICVLSGIGLFIEAEGVLWSVCDNECDQVQQ